MLQNRISHGKAHNDPVVVETSLKLASVYARMGKKELALTGYQWCSNACRKSISDMKKVKDRDEEDKYLNLIRPISL